ncbi:MAG: asparagine synthase (glutamine-hydrolyzing) [Candidatus Hydrogenedens sp.]|nr:asparagine synthase (glutamine-hydrolyzing) [Candidatus Hydrogenedens sp.]
MCGICGKVLHAPGARVSERSVQDMATLIAHRGPDDEGFHFDGEAGLGFRRLSIIDVAGGHQPMCNEDGRVWIVFNGEIYNHRELRAELIAKGHEFKTHSDTETILHLYEEAGEACPERLRGMFAFAIWDARDRSLFVARDRFGIKPLYYRATAETFAFCSELKPLLYDAETTPDLDPVAISDYFSSYVFGERTMFQSIRRLLPAHWMRVRGGEVTTRRYWQPELDAEVTGRSAGENLEALRALLQEAMREHMMSEVPQGAYLSGGVDSSLITILMNEAGAHPVKTFCSTFPGGGAFDESGYAAKVARAFNTEHHEIPCQPEHIGLLPKVLWHLEEPLADAPTIALYQLCQEAAKQVTVVHCGDGGDEAFAGYTRYYWDRFAGAYNRVPGAIRHGMLPPVWRALQAMPGPLRNLGRRAEKFSRYSDLPEAERYMSWFCVNPDSAKAAMLTPEFQALSGAHRSAGFFERLFADARACGTDNLGTLQYCDLHNFVPYSLMLKGDKLTMAASIEGRFLWLDHRLVNFGLSLPPDQKMQGRHTKVPPRKVFQSYWNDPDVWRPKQGFGVPIEDWFKGSLREEMETTIEAAQRDVMQVVRPEAIRTMADQLMAGDPHVWPHLWSVYVFYTWRRVFEHIRQDCAEIIRTTTDPFARARAEEG